MSTIRDNFGARLRSLRVQRGWTQDELAEKARLNRTYVGDVERGERNISLLNLRKLAISFDISLSVLLEGVDGE